MHDKGKLGVTQGPVYHVGYTAVNPLRFAAMYHIGYMAMNPTRFTGKVIGSCRKDSLAAA